MQRDWDLVRKILVHVAQLPSDRVLWAGELDGHEDEPRKVIYQIDIMRRAGLLKAQGGDCLTATSITWEGNNFLDGIEEDSAWERVKGWVIAKGTTLSFETIKAGISALAQQAIT